MKTHDLREVTALAEKVIAPKYSPEMVQEKQMVADEYRKAGFIKIASDIDQSMNRKMKLARIAEFEYKVLRKEHFQHWLDNLVFEEKKNDEWRFRFSPFGGIDSMGNLIAHGGSIYAGDILHPITFSNSISGTPYLNLASYQQAVSMLQNQVAPTSISIGYRSKTIAERSSIVEVNGKNYRIMLEEELVENYKNVPPLEIIKKLNQVKENRLFDTYVVIYPTVKEIIQDPLLCGKIHEEKDQWFFIAEWGDDIKLEQLLN